MAHVRNLHSDVYNMKPDKGHLLLTRVRFILNCEYAESPVTSKEESSLTIEQETPVTIQEESPVTI